MVCSHERPEQLHWMSAGSKQAGRSRSAVPAGGGLSSCLSTLQTARHLNIQFVVQFVVIRSPLKSDGPGTIKKRPGRESPQRRAPADAWWRCLSVLRMQALTRSSRGSRSTRASRPSSSLACCQKPSRHVSAFGMSSKMTKYSRSERNGQTYLKARERLKPLLP